MTTTLEIPDRTLDIAYPGCDGRQVALVVAHPGHEMRVHAWLELARPHVFVLTDGSGHYETGRIASTAEVVAAAGAVKGSIFGRLSDREAYALILDQRLDELKTLILELACELELAGTEALVGDAVEGFNPVHDLCFVISRTAAIIASKRLGYQIEHYDFWLEAAPDASARQDSKAARIRLSSKEFERKMRAAEAYGALRDEVERTLAAHGSEAFSLEVMRPVSPDIDWVEMVGAKPFYEIHGELRVAEGFYSKLIRFREHFLPLAEALRVWSLA